MAVQTEYAHSRKAVDKAIDTYLDIILEAQKDIHNMNKSVSDLYELIYSSFSSFTKDDYFQINASYRRLIRNLIDLYNEYRKSDFYPGIKTELKTFRSSIDDLQEIANDMKTFIVDLPQNRDYKNLISTINSL